MKLQELIRQNHIRSDNEVYRRCKRLHDKIKKEKANYSGSHRCAATNKYKSRSIKRILTPEWFNSLDYLNDSCLSSTEKLY